MANLSSTIEKGKALLAQAQAKRRPSDAHIVPMTPAPPKEQPKTLKRATAAPPILVKREPLIDQEKFWKDDLKAQARRQLGEWIDAKADFAAERMRLIEAFAETARRGKEDYIAGHREVFLDGLPFPEAHWSERGRRKYLIVDTVARYIFLQKRQYPAGEGRKYGGPYELLLSPDAIELAQEVVDEEIRRRGA